MLPQHAWERSQTVGPGETAAPGETALPDESARTEFHRFFQRHHRELARLAFLLLGDQDGADDLAAEALTAAWQRWDRVRAADQPLAYVRRMVVNMSRSRIRALVRERDKAARLSARMDDRVREPDVPAVVDVRAALRTLPPRKRACVVLRFGFDMSEKDTARVLGVAVGTVKSQTAKAVAELARHLADPQLPERRLTER
ncbi:SigE family RNA polymerase sigma factor [Actinomadura mexicana]|uniref:RNA polymerase sigma-70 factor, sigma-E family n=1 Tax=Actinomadura mexicana TaxID=134959 RepID=A0A238VQ62_9ACTN|nr:SigE family RNA polymerase sigma factor [Actinomadura mexicana]SNR36512.1 RNA polymerase sigma-70 factor, sigma-E family [Actinomadura mexicana]